MLPNLPPRRKVAGASQSNASQSSASQGAVKPGDFSKVEAMAKQLVNNPGINQLLSNPELISNAVQQDPNLRAMLAHNPQMASLLSAEKLQQVTEALKDPAKLIMTGQELLPADSDMTLNRKTLMEVQQYAQNLHRRALENAGSALVPSAGGSSSSAAGAAGTGDVAVAMQRSMAKAQDRLTQLMQLKAMQSTGDGVGVGRSMVLPAQDSEPQPDSAPSLSSWHSKPSQFYSPTVAYTAQQAAASSSTPSTQGHAPGAVRAMHAPLQHQSLYSGLHDRATGGSYQGSYTFSHSEKEVTLKDLPVEAQQQLLAQMGMQDGVQGHVHGPGCGHDHHNHSSTTTIPQAPPGSEEAKQMYGLLYQQYMESMRAYEAASGPEGGPAAGIDRPDPSSMWAAYYLAYPEAAQAAQAAAGQGQGQSAVGPGAGAARYYEQVQPSDWKPENQDECWELYRRAYCSKADAVWPPLWVMLGIIAANYVPMVPFWVLSILMPIAFICGMAFFTMVLAGIPSSELATSRTIASLIASLELAIWVVSVFYILPDYSPRWGISSLILGGSMTALPILHLVAHLTDPGYVDIPSKNNINTDSTNNKDDDEAPSHAPDAGAHAAISSKPHTAGVQGSGSKDETQPLLGSKVPQGDDADLGHLNTCHTCKVPRPMRSKHCPLCNRCVHRFDHHCPAIYNCVGAGNQRMFAAYMMCMCLAQCSWLAVGFNYLQQVYTQEVLRHMPQQTQQVGISSADVAAAAAVMASMMEEADSRWCSWAAVSHAATAHRGILMLLIIQIPLWVAGLLLVMRLYSGIAGNLTTNEMINRKRYPYLNHELAGYCNRFDRGPVHNCFQFWLEPHQDWWALFEAGDREMVVKRVTMLTTWGPGLVLRSLDVMKARRQDFTRRAQEARLAKQLQEQAGGTLDQGKVKQLVAAAGIGKDAEACGSGACRHAHD